MEESGSVDIKERKCNSSFKEMHTHKIKAKFTTGNNDDRFLLFLKNIESLLSTRQL